MPDVIPLHAPPPQSAPPTPTDDVFAGIAAGARMQHREPVDSAPLKTPPRWLRRPCGANFAVSCRFIIIACCTVHVHDMCMYMYTVEPLNNVTFGTKSYSVHYREVSFLRRL